MSKNLLGFLMETIYYDPWECYLVHSGNPLLSNYILTGSVRCDLYAGDVGRPSIVKREGRQQKKNTRTASTEYDKLIPLMTYVLICVIQSAVHDTGWGLEDEGKT